MDQEIRIFQSAGREAVLCLLDMNHLQDKAVLANPYLGQSGIYLLVSEEEPARLSLYVGQSMVRKNQDALLNRISEHRLVPDRPDWSHAIALTWKDRGMSKAELDYLENRLFSMLRQSAPIRLINERRPPYLREPESWMDLEQFVRDLTAHLNDIGIRTFGQISLFHQNPSLLDS